LDAATALLASGIAGVVLFTLVWLVEGLVRAGYRPMYHPISALSLGPRGWIQVTNFIVTGVLLLGFAIGLHAAGAAAPVAILFGVVGSGLIGSGVFSMDAMRGYPPGAIEGDPPEYSVRHRRHDRSSIVVFLAVPAAAIVSGIAGSGAWRWYSFATAVVGLGLLAWFSIAYERDTPRAGSIQRSLVIGNWTWIALLGLRHL
jgi:hypothetical membrane protein